jgi:hypothetical protein
MEWRCFITDAQALKRALHDIAKIRAGIVEREVLRKPRFPQIPAVPMEDRHPDGPRPLAFHPAQTTCTHRVPYFEICRKCGRTEAIAKRHAQMLLFR